MAGIKSDIVLNDKMSPVLRDMKKQLNNVTQALEDVEKTGGDAFDDAEMRDFKQALSQISEELEKVERDLNQAGKSAEKGEGKFEKLGNVLKTVGKAAVAVGAVSVAGVAKLTKDSVESYGNYEQLVGGVETLFGTGGLSLKKYAAQEGKSVAEVKREYKTLTAAQNAVLKNANKAYKTAGLSANEYMETATGFAASLVSALSGDTTKAAAYADRAVIDMADNANKMGSDISSIQNAYQGFAKQNYTMLDNLKLGYGGTKEEMERLLRDAEKLSGQKYDISSFADITDAIHVVQDEMGITGTTAKEAEGTIQGSLNMVKASWQNVLTALVVGGEQYEQSVDALVSSVTAFVKNIMPAIEKALSGIGDLMSSLAPKIAEELPEMFEEVLPKLSSAITSLLGSIGEVLPSFLKTVVSQFPSMIPVFIQAVLSLVDAIVENLPLVLNAALELVTVLTQELAQASPELMPAIVQMVVDIADTLIKNADSLLPAALQLIQSLLEGLIIALPTLISALPQIIVAIQSFLLENTSGIMEAGVALLEAIIDAMPMIISLVCAALPQLIFAMINNLINHSGEFLSTGVKLTGALIQGLMSMVGSVVQLIFQFCKQMVASFEAFVANMENVGGDLLRGLWNGISDAVGGVIEKVKGVGSKILNSIKDVLGVHSPSKEFAEVGDYLMQGLGNGISDNEKYAITATQSVAKDVLNAASGLNANAQIGATFTGVTGSMAELDGGTYELMRNYAAQDSVNKFTTSQINIDMGGVTNQIASGNDVDDLITKFVEGVREALSTSSQGVHKR